MLAPWAVEEMMTASLDDQRLNARLTQLLSDLGCRPTASIPAACGGSNEMTAAYRFFDNDKVNPDNILQPHAEQTRRRMAQQDTVLLIQDTTEVDLTRPQPAGPGDRATRWLGPSWCLPPSPPRLRHRRHSPGHGVVPDLGPRSRSRTAIEGREAEETQGGAHRAEGE
jgi:Transposase DNA-binding